MSRLDGSAAPLPSGRRLARLCTSLFLLPAAMAACGDDPVTGPNTPPGIQFVSGNDASDTIGTALRDPLVVEVRGADGQRRQGAIVRFEALPADVARCSSQTALVLSGVDSDVAGSVVQDTTDDRGQAMVRVSFHTVATTGYVRVSVPELGLVDTATFTVLPGEPTRLVVGVRDTTIYVGRRYSIGGIAADRCDNPRSEPAIRYSGVGGVTVDAGGAVTTTAVGRAQIHLSAGLLTDVVRAWVVPAFTIVAVSGGNVVSVGLDGSALDTLATDGTMPTWLPGNTGVLFTAGTPARLVQVDFAGRRSELLTSRPASLLSEGYGRFSSDGRWVYFTGWVAGSTNGTLWRARWDGSGAEPLAAADGAPYVYGARPDPSPDGTRVTFSGPWPALYYVVSADTTTIKVLDLASGTRTALGVYGRASRYSPDGARLAAIRPWGAESRYSDQVYVANADGSGMRVLGTVFRGGVSSVDWSPDGAWLLTETGYGEGAPYRGLQLINADTGEVLLLPWSAGLGQASFQR